MSDTAVAIEKPKPLTSSDVRACIQANFGMNGEQYAVLFEVRNGTAWRANRSVDAVVMGLWPSLGMELWGMEIKTARGDWQRELANPSKASEVFNHFDRWFLVAPEGVAKADEVPTPWGWYIPKDGRLLKVRDAAKNPERKPVDNHFLAALMRRVAKTDDAFIASAVQQALQNQRRELDADIEKRTLQRLGELKEDAESWLKLRDLLKLKPDDYVYQPEVVAALQVVLRAGVAKSYGGIRSLLDTVDRAHAELGKVRKDLALDAVVSPKPRRVAP
ncbi:MAG: hypothetical protein JWP25_3583 [Bradyrhizobium sp.]|nr:hypothetical protein [Bradyrhizobium sp.]